MSSQDVLTMTLMTDDAELERIVDEVRSGEQGAFAHLVQRVRGRVRSWAMRYTPDEDVAEDIAQDVMIDLQRRVKYFHGRSRFSTWLFIVTKNTAINHTRLERRRAQLLDTARVEANEAPRADDVFDAHTVSELVLNYFDQLPARQRLIFERVDLRGESAADVARALNMQAATVRTHLFKARRAIRARMLELHEPLIKEFLS